MVRLHTPWGKGGRGLKEGWRGGGKGGRKGGGAGREEEEGVKTENWAPLPRVFHNPNEIESVRRECELQSVITS